MQVFVPIWKEAPFLRLVIPLILGIAMQWYCSLPKTIYLFVITCCVALTIIFAVIRSFTKFRHYWITGLAINIMVAVTGGLLARSNDVRYQHNWINHYSHHGSVIIATLKEPLSRKNKSFKATASINFIGDGNSVRRAQGDINIYFINTEDKKNLTHHSRIAFRKSLLPIRNSGNPGAFDYERYCAFRNIYHQVFLKPGEYLLLPDLDKNLYDGFFNSAREKVLQVLRTYVPGRQEAGLAEALLVGYKDDLDKMLVQSYTNAGVIHIIAISGLHVGLIYWLVSQLVKPLGRKRYMAWLRPLLSVCCLWMFSILAGGSPSVLRSALMFTFIILGDATGKSASIYNSLAASAFLLLCVNPFWLWDAGFQLSYIAVLSIVVFMRPIYSLLDVKNRLLDLLWKSCAVCLAAQILTTPISIYLFHQFPNYFLITNMVAVPLSSLIVFGEIVLLTLTFDPFISSVTGIGLSACIRFMNRFVIHMEKMPFATTGGLQMSFTEVALVYIVIALTWCWIFQRSKYILIVALVVVCALAAMRSAGLARASRQNKLIVYNIPNHQAVDLIRGRSVVFTGDSALHNSSVLFNIHIKPSRVMFRVKNEITLPANRMLPGAFYAGRKRIVIVRSPRASKTSPVKVAADIVIVSGNPTLSIDNLLKTIEFKFLVVDSSNPTWKVDRWKKECAISGIPFYAVAEKGAFILDLN